jgi:hypothetical protein
MELQDFKELTKAVYEIDKKMGILIQKNDDYILANTSEHNALCNRQDDLNTILKDHNGRLKRLEKWKYGIVGGLTVIIFLLGWIWDFVRSKI